MRKVVDDLLVDLREAENAEHTGGLCAGLSAAEWETELEEKHRPIAARHLFADQPWICRQHWQAAESNGNGRITLELQGDSFVEESVKLQLNNDITMFTIMDAKGQMQQCYCSSPVVKIVSFGTKKVHNGIAKLTIPTVLPICSRRVFTRKAHLEWQECTQQSENTANASIIELSTFGEFVVAQASETAKLKTCKTQEDKLLVFVYVPKQTRNVKECVEELKATSINHQEVQLVRDASISINFEDENNGNQSAQQNATWTGEMLQFNFDYTIMSNNITVREVSMEASARDSAIHVVALSHESDLP